jgi:hypothetical protein
MSKQDIAIFCGMITIKIFLSPIPKCTLGFLAKISFTPLLFHPGGCLWCPEKRTSSRNYNLFVWSTVFQPKWHGIRKTYKDYQNPVKRYRFFRIFSEFVQFWLKNSSQNQLGELKLTILLLLTSKLSLEAE